MRYPTECDFDRQFLFDEYVAISHRYVKSIIEKLNNCSFVVCKDLMFSHVYDAHDSLLNFHSVFLDTLYMLLI
jgi:predicted sulfurtransferase